MKGVRKCQLECSPSLLDPSHQHPDLVSRHLLGGPDLEQLPFVHHPDDVGELEDLVKVCGDHQDALPRVPGLQKESAYVVRRRDVESPRWLGGKDKVRV